MKKKKMILGRIKNIGRQTKKFYTCFTIRISCFPKTDQYIRPNFIMENYFIFILIFDKEEFLFLSSDVTIFVLERDQPRRYSTLRTRSFCEQSNVVFGSEGWLKNSESGRTNVGGRSVRGKTEVSTFGTQTESRSESHLRVNYKLEKKKSVLYFHTKELLNSL